MSYLINWLKGVLSLAFPENCQICKTEGELFCKSCLANIHALEMQQCPGCFSISPNGIFCRKCSAQQSGLDFLLVGTSYRHSPIVPLLIKTLKYKSISRCISYLPVSLYASLESFISLAPILVPVPLHKKRKKERGFNQAHLITSQICRLLNLELRNNIINRIRYTKPQAQLGKHEREVNLKGAFEIQSPALIDPERLYILIDDVATTRSTLEECAKVMRAAGIKRIGAYVLARK